MRNFFDKALLHTSTSTIWYMASFQSRLRNYRTAGSNHNSSFSVWRYGSRQVSSKTLYIYI